MSRCIRKRFIALLVVGTIGSATGCAKRPSDLQTTESTGCSPSRDLVFICGVDRPEDLAHIPGTRWLIASGFSAGAGLKLIDTEANTMRFWYTADASQLQWDARSFPLCSQPPDAKFFNVQGISLRVGAEAGSATLYATNHGGRESIEVFAIDSRTDTPTLKWRGCVLMPPGLAANSVASFSDGTVLVTVLTHPGTTITDFVKGANTGGVYEWRPGTEDFHLIPGTELPGNNGLETSRDDKEFYVVAFGWHAVVAFDRAAPDRSRRQSVAPGFMPDNIHWDGDRLIAAGMQYDEPACGGVRRIIDGKADEMLCHRGYVVAQLDPVSMAFSVLAYAEPDPRFNGVSAAVFVGNQLWLGSYQADRIAHRRFRRSD